MKKPKFDKLDSEEQAIEDAMERGEYVSVSKKEFQRIKASIDAYKKDAVLNIRINRNDLMLLKSKAKKLGVPYQRMIGEFLHRLAQG